MSGSVRARNRYDKENTFQFRPRQFGGMMDIYCLGGKTWLICGPKEATLSNIPVGAASRPPKCVLDSLGFLWTANQTGFSPMQ